MSDDQRSRRRNGDVLLDVNDLVVAYTDGASTVQAVAGVSFDVRHGETLGLVGESGCGKSSTGRAVAMLRRPRSGSVMYEGRELTDLRGEDLRRIRLEIQMIFQDPISSLNPRRTVRDIVAQGPAIWGRSPKRDEVLSLLHAVGIDPSMADRRPHELSGGQCQRVSIARALALKPKLVICDEPVSALDVSVQAQILNLLEDLKEQFDLNLVFIAHDLAVVKNVSDRVAVMYLGRICEIGDAAQVFERPQHPYTRVLLDAVPIPNPEVPVANLRLRDGELPSPVNPPSGCRFRTRCPRAQERCATESPDLRAVGEDHFVACHYPLDEVFNPAETG